MRVKLIAGFVCVFLFTLITLTIMQIEKANMDTNTPVATQGLLDLSNYDLTVAGSIPLNGDWEYYEGQLLGVGQIYSGDYESLKTIVPVPGRWNEYPIKRGSPLSFGTGTYILHIKLSEISEQVLGIKTSNIGMSNKIYINDMVIGQSGTPGLDKNSYIPKNVPYSSFFLPKSDGFDIIVWVSNYDYTPYSGIVNPIYFGTHEGITKLSSSNSVKDLIGIASFLIIGLLFFTIFLYRRKSIYLLCFSLYCFVTDLYVITHGEKLLYDLIPSMDYRIFSRIQYFSASMFIIMLLLYLYYSYPQLFKNIATKSLIVISVAFVPVCIFAPLSLQSIWSGYQIIFIQIVMLYSVYGLIVGILNGVEDSIYVGIASLAMLFMVISAAWDVLGRVPINSYLPVAQVIFILSHSFLISARLSRTFTQVETLSRELILLDKQKNDFLARTSHEFKIPLNGIMNIAQLYIEREDKNLSEEQLQNMNQVIHIADRLSKLVNDIIDMTKLHEGKLSLKLGPLDVNSSLKDIFEVALFIYDGSGNKLVYEVDDELPHVIADKDRFRQIIYNLIAFSMNNTYRGVVKLKAISGKNNVSISIEDSGLGIDEKKLSSIFDPYINSTDNFNTADVTGLGLAIVKQLMEAQGGNVQATSNVGQGSCFTVMFSIDDKEALVAKPLGQDILVIDEISSNEESIIDSFGAATPYIVNPDGKGTILLVDDNASNLKLLIDILTQGPNKIIAVKTGEEALEQIQSLDDVDVIVLDIMMPGMSGYEVCRSIRTRFNSLELPILMLNSAVNTEDSEVALLVGANDILHKPFQLNEFKARVNSLISMKQSATLSASYEVAFLNAQIKPHFLYNALNTIASYCEIESPGTAELIISLARYLRGTLDFSNLENLVPVDKEISLIQAYFKIECARFPDLKITYDIDDDLNVLIPPLSLQILVENGVKHGRHSLGDIGEIVITGKKIEGGVYFSVLDNGEGIPEQKARTILAHPQKDGSIGLYNLHNRLVRMLGSGLEIGSSIDQGSVVSFTVKERK